MTFTACQRILGRGQVEVCAQLRAISFPLSIILHAAFVRCLENRSGMKNRAYKLACRLKYRNESCYREEGCSWEAVGWNGWSG